MRNLKQFCQKNGVDLAKDRLDHSYLNMNVTTDLQVALDQQGNLIGFLIGSSQDSQNKMALTLTKKDRSQKRERLSPIFIPLNLINDRDLIDIQVGIGGISRSLLSFRDVKIDRVHGGYMRLGLMSSPLLGRQHDLQLKIEKGERGGFIAARIEDANQVFNSDYLDGSSLNQPAISTSLNKRLSTLELRGGVMGSKLIATYGDLDKTPAILPLSTVAQNELIASAKKTIDLTRKYTNRTTELTVTAAASVCPKGVDPSLRLAQGLPIDCCKGHKSICGCRLGRLICCDGTVSKNPNCTCSR